MNIAGYCDPHFQSVADAFEANFIQRNELGGGVCVTLEGERVVDLWGGHVSAEEGADAWTEDTLCVVFSCTKAATALCAHLLIDRGQLALDDKVADHWPAFAQNGKAEVTVAQLLNHSAGLPALRAVVPDGGSYDFAAMAERLAAEAPFWDPGTRTGYEMTSFGWLVGEIVRRVSGKSLGTFFADEIAKPHDLDFWIGLPQSEEHRVAPVELNRPQPGEPLNPFISALMADPASIQHLATFNSGRANPNHRAFRAAELGGHGGVSNAKGLAGLLTPLANGAMLPDEIIADLARQKSVTGLDQTLLIPSRFSHGFMLPMDNCADYAFDGSSLLAPDGAFGHVGLGGTLTLCWPKKRMAFGYCTNRHGPGMLLNPRGQSLLDAAVTAASAL